VRHHVVIAAAALPGPSRTFTAVAGAVYWRACATEVRALDTDAVVIGAGVVGLACARELAARGRSVVILERHERFGAETSSRNSEVVHAGIYYPPGSLKATLCAHGNPSLYAWCAARGVAHRRLGKLIVAAAAAEEPKLETILAQADANGVRSLERLTPARAAAFEPHVRCTAALWSPDTGIVDSHALMASFLADAEVRGATAAWRQTVRDVEPVTGGYRVMARDGGGETAAIETPWVVNAAGLDADTVAALAGFDLDACGYRQHYAAGRYFRLAAGKSHLARHLVYPAPPNESLGIHVTLDLAGGVRLGPDLEYLPDRRQNYDVAEGLRERFHAAVSRYLVGLAPEDLAPDLAGIRPKLQGPGQAFRDFVIRDEADRGRPGWVNLVGIESPGLTSCLEIGALVATLLEGGP
jgi:L-2-hydroxyglutarate oxidase LhgO